MAGSASVRTVAETVADEIRAIVDYHSCRVCILQEPDDLVPAAQEIVVPPEAGAAANVPRLPRLGAIPR